MPAETGETSPAGRGWLPTLLEAQRLAHDLLGSEGTRWAHVSTAGRVAATLRGLFDEAEATLLQIAATLHDIGYSPRIRRTGFHPLDGAGFLRSEGCDEALVVLVAHHSLARMTAGAHLDDLLAGFPAGAGLLADALTYSDMHSAPDGRLIRVEHRLADIAARHPEPAQVRRATGLRLAIARVEHARAGLVGPELSGAGVSLAGESRAGAAAADQAAPRAHARALARDALARRAHGSDGAASPGASPERVRSA